MEDINMTDIESVFNEVTQAKGMILVIKSLQQVSSDETKAEKLVKLLLMR